MNKETLKKYFSGRLSSKEQKEVEMFLKSTKNQDDGFWKQIWDESNNKVSEDISNQLQNRIDDFKNTTTKTQGVNHYRLLKIAAVLTVLIGIGSLLFFIMKQPTWETIYNSQMITREVKLKDGSLIWLKPKSSISISNEFNEQQREVKLKGAAYFDVEKDSERPFIVKAGNVKTEVLGTMFNIQAFDFERNVQIVLTEGSVRISMDTLGKQSEIATLEPNQIMVYDKIGNNVSIDRVNFSEEELFKGNKQVFHNEPIVEFLKRMSLLYKLNINIDNLTFEERSARITGVFEIVEPISAINNILFIYNLSIEKTGDIYTVISNKEK